MANQPERPSTDDFRRFFGSETYAAVMGVSIAIGEGTELDTSSPKHRLIAISKGFFEEAIGEAMSEMAVAYGGEFDFDSEKGKEDFIKAIQGGNALALVELGMPDQNEDFFKAIHGEV